MPTPASGAHGPSPGTDLAGRPRAAPAGEAFLDRGPSLPSGYGADRLVGLARDPGILHYYWMLDGEKGKVPPSGVDAHPVLRVLDVDTGTLRDLAFPLGARNAYVDAVPGRRYRAEIGYHDAHGKFRPVASAAEVATPPAAPSDVIDPDWPTSAEEYALLLAFHDPSRNPHYEKRERS